MSCIRSGISCGIISDHLTIFHYSCSALKLSITMILRKALLNHDEIMKVWIELSRHRWFFIRHQVLLMQISLPCCVADDMARTVSRKPREDEV